MDTPTSIPWTASVQAAVLADRFEQNERQNRFLYMMLTRNGGAIDKSLVGVPGVDPFLEPQAGRELESWARRAREVEAARIEKLHARGKRDEARA
jgi:hypothetical protein